MIFHRPILSKINPLTLVGVCLITLLFTSVANSQCVDKPNDACTAVHQSILDRAAKAIDELTEARKVISAFQNERTATEAERAAYKNLAQVTDTALNVLQKGIADREQLIALQQKTIELYAVLVEKLQAQINKPKSGWSKFLGAVEKVVFLVAGAAIGGVIR